MGGGLSIDDTFVATLLAKRFFVFYCTFYFIVINHKHENSKQKANKIFNKKTAANITYYYILYTYYIFHISQLLHNEFNYSQIE